MIRFTIAPVDGSPMTMLVGMPDDVPGGSAARVPALVLMPHRAGIDIFTIDRAERLAAAGIATVAPDLYHWQDVTVPTTEGKENLIDERIEADIGAALAFIKRDARIDNERIGILGHCQGGRTALLGLVAYPDDFCLGVIYYGGSVFKRLNGKQGGSDGPSPLERLAVVTCPVAGFFGNEDKNPSPDDVDRLEAEMTRHNIPHAFHRFDGAGHAFQDFTDERRGREPQGEKAWAMTMDFLRPQLRPAAPA